MTTYQQNKTLEQSLTSCKWIDDYINNNLTELTKYGIVFDKIFEEYKKVDNQIAKSTFIRALSLMAIEINETSNLCFLL